MNSGNNKLLQMPQNNALPQQQNGIQKAKNEINTTWIIPDVDCWVLVGQEEPTTEVMYVLAKIKSRVQNVENNKSSTNQQQEVEIRDVKDINFKHINRIKVDLVHQVNLLQDNGYNDMVEMDYLNEPEILINLQRRYAKDLIYTFIGPTLVVMNPYKTIPALFSKNVLNLFYTQAKQHGHIDYKKLPPHTYAVAAQAYCKLFEREKNQAIVISGESGAGKTENAKTCMCFLTGLSGSDQGQAAHDQTNNNTQKNGQQSNIEDRILGCNPILEAFGNAKTVRNDNSSRFGKFVQIQVGKNSRKIKGATITNYLLEKSRVTTPGQGERNYHIFYHLLFCGQNQLLQTLHLENEFSKPETFYYLQNSGCFTVPTINDKMLFEEVQEAFHTMGISSEEQDTIYRIISAILLLGNVDFDQSTLTDTQPCKVKQENLLRTISSLLKVDYTQLLKCINQVTRKIGSSIIYSPKKLDETISSRDSIARNLYDRMFSWIVTRLNSSININENGQKQSKDNEVKLCVGLLDIFGFEVFNENSFEQFCINFTNEKLQQLYIQYVFKSEEQEFINEGLSNYISQLGYKDNQNIIFVLDNTLGIFQLIDESSALGSSDDKKLYESIKKIYNGKPEVKFSLKGQKSIFTIVHTAKPVDYCIDGFREKNKAEVSQELSMTIVESNDSVLSSIFLGIQEQMTKQEKIAILNQQQNQTKGSKENKFLGCKFRAQMKQLMDELISADCHFIRCIKPNEVKKPNNFLQGFVLIQIKYLGVLQAILSRKEGFPYRKDFKLFFQQFSGMVDKYRSLSLQKIESQKLSIKDICVDILQIKFNESITSQILIGKTKMFTKDEFGKKLDDMLFKWYEQKKVFLKKIISQYQSYKFKKSVKMSIQILIKAIKIFIKIQATFKMRKQRLKFLKLKQGVKQLYKYFGKKIIKGFFKQWNLKTRQMIVAERNRKREQEEKEAQRKIEEEKDMKIQLERQKAEKAERELQQKAEREEKERQLNLQQQQQQEQNLEQPIIEGSLNHNSLERNNNYQSVLSSEYASVSNYNTFNAANQINNYDEIKDNYKQLQDDYQSSKGEADMNEKMKYEYDKIQQMNREILENDLDCSQQRIKTKSKIEYFLNLDNPKQTKAPPNEKSKDCFIDFSICNQATIDKIQQNNYFKIVSQLIAQRRKNMNEIYSLQERMQYEKKAISKPLTSIYKPYEPAACKAFQYMLKYAGDKSYEEEHPRIIVWKLLQLILEQDEQDVTDEIFLQVIKQLTNNTSNNVEQYFKIAALIASTVIVSPRILFPVMNFFYEQSNYYEQQNQPRNQEWCKYILSRIGNSQNQDENNNIASFVFKREEIPLKEEFIAIENMHSIQIPIYFYGDRCRYYKVESYNKVCSLVSLIGQDLQIISDNPNWYGVVEYLTIDGITTTQILDFGMRVLDWRAKKYRERQSFLSSNPGKKYDYKLYYEIIILHQVTAQDIDVNLMMYLTYANEYLHNIYFLDIQQNKSLSSQSSSHSQMNNRQVSQIIQYNEEFTEIDFIVDIAAAKTISDYKIFKKENINVRNCVPFEKLHLLNSDVWRIKIEFQIGRLLPTLKTQRKARTYFLNKMKYYQGKYFFSQKFFCKFSKCLSTQSEYQDETDALCLTKLGHVYIIQLSTNRELETISLRDIKDFSVNYISQSLYLHARDYSYQITSQYQLNIYYNIMQYCSTIEEIDQQMRNIVDEIQDSPIQNQNYQYNSDKMNSKQINNEEYQESFNTSNKLTNDNIISESKLGDYYSQSNQKYNQYNEEYDYENNNNYNNESPESINHRMNGEYNSANKKNGVHVQGNSYGKNNSCEMNMQNSPKSQYSSGQNKLLPANKINDQKYLDGSKMNLNDQFQNMDCDQSNIDQTNRSNNLYEHLI